MARNPRQPQETPDKYDGSGGETEGAFCCGLNAYARRVLRIVDASPHHLDEWREIHNAIIPTAPLSAEEVAARATRNRLTVAFDGDTLVGNSTVRSPDADGTVVVIVRILPEYRRRGLGSTYLAHELEQARVLVPCHVATVVLASNQDGLAFALARGFAEVDRYLLPGDEVPFVELRLTDPGGTDRSGAP